MSLTSDIDLVLDEIEALDTVSSGAMNIDLAFQAYESMVATDGQPGSIRLAILLSYGVPSDFPSANAEVVPPDHRLMGVAFDVIRVLQSNQTRSVPRGLCMAHSLP